FVSITGDLIGSIHTVSFDAFDIFGNLLDTDGGRDRGGRIYSVAAQSIHEVRFSGVNTPTIGGSGGVGLDDLTFNPVDPIPEPGTVLLLGLGLVGLAARKRQRP
ncbi:MAG: PEP-CTERM sorting domain-containing protein, partial [bacterium]